LVEQLGGMTVGEFLAKASSQEILYWRKYSEIKNTELTRKKMDARAQENRPKV
jgi:hypothetical protein